MYNKTDSPIVRFNKFQNVEISNILIQTEINANSNSLVSRAGGQP